jgi:hypothetical protein
LSTSPISKLRAANDKRRQAKRNSLADKLTVEAKVLADLKIEKAAAESERRMVEADLGLVKYLATLFGQSTMWCCGGSSSLWRCSWIPPRCSCYWRRQRANSGLLRRCTVAVGQNDSGSVKGLARLPRLPSEGCDAFHWSSRFARGHDRYKQ